MERDQAPILDNSKAIVYPIVEAAIQQDTAKEAETLHNAVPRGIESPVADPHTIYTSLTLQQRARRRRQIHHNKQMATARLMSMYTIAAGSFASARHQQRFN